MFYEALEKLSRVSVDISLVKTDGISEIGEIRKVLREEYQLKETQLDEIIDKHNKQVSRVKYYKVNEKNMFNAITALAAAIERFRKPEGLKCFCDPSESMDVPIEHTQACLSARIALNSSMVNTFVKAEKAGTGLKLLEERAKFSPGVAVYDPPVEKESEPAGSGT